MFKESWPGFSVSSTTQAFPVRGVLKGPLSVDELTLAELLAVKRAKMESFLDDCKALLNNLPLLQKVSSWP